MVSSTYATVFIACIFVRGAGAYRTTKRYGTGDKAIALLEAERDAEKISDSCEKRDLQNAPKPYSLWCDEYMSSIRKAFKTASVADILKKYRINLEEGGEEGSGKSGASLFFTPDKRYVFKTMTPKDFSSFEGIAKQYSEHMAKKREESLIVRVFAIIEDTKHQKWMLMNNWLPLKFPTVYDLKGSTEGRYEEPKPDSSVPLKDVNWLQGNESVMLPMDLSKHFRKVLEEDSELLAKLNLLDYSLILGQMSFDVPTCGAMWQPSCVSGLCFKGQGCIDLSYATDKPEAWLKVREQYCPSSPETAKTHSCQGAVTTAGRGKRKVYISCFGIIDLLKYYGKTARIEWLGRGGLVGKDISVQRPDNYKERFDNFMYRSVFTNPELRREGQLLKFRPSESMCQHWGARDKVAFVLPYSAITMTFLGVCIFLSLLIVFLLMLMVYKYMKVEESRVARPIDKNTATHPSTAGTSVTSNPGVTRTSSAAASTPGVGSRVAANYPSTDPRCSPASSSVGGSSYPSTRHPTWEEMMMKQQRMPQELGVPPSYGGGYPTIQHAGSLGFKAQMSTGHTVHQKTQILSGGAQQQPGSEWGSSIQRLGSHPVGSPAASEWGTSMQRLNSQPTGSPPGNEWGASMQRLNSQPSGAQHGSEWGASMQRLNSQPGGAQHGSEWGASMQRHGSQPY